MACADMSYMVGKITYLLNYVCDWPLHPKWHTDVNTDIFSFEMYTASQKTGVKQRLRCVSPSEYRKPKTPLKGR